MRILVLNFFRCDLMRNVTITLPEDLARWLDIRAAEDYCSASRWVAQLLEEKRRQEAGYETAMNRALSIPPRSMEWVDGRKPYREELHDRARFRGHKQVSLPL